MPLRVGITRTQFRAGSAGSATSPRWSIDRALVATSARPPDALTIAKEGIDLWKVSANTGAPSGAGPPPARSARGPQRKRGGPLFYSPSHGFPVLRGARVWHREAPVSRRHAPSLDPPAPLAGDLRQASVRIHSHRSADKLEHSEVRKRVRVGEALGQDDSIAG